MINKDIYHHSRKQMYLQSMHISLYFISNHIPFNHIFVRIISIFNSLIIKNHFDQPANKSFIFR